VPSDGQGRLVVYLPGPVASSLPTVRRAIADAPAARQFLEALNLAEPDVVAEVLQIVLPRYDGLEVAKLDPARHAADVECVVRALDEATSRRREELLERVRQAAFLIGENAADGAVRLMPPPALYQRSKELEAYFDGNPGIWFAADRYGPWLAQLRPMGVRQAVEVRARTPNELGYVLVTIEFGRNERGLDGFDPAAEIDGLDFALRHRPRPFGICLERPACPEPPSGRRRRGAVGTPVVLGRQPGAGHVGDRGHRRARSVAAGAGRGVPAAGRAVPRRPAADVRAGRGAGPGAGHAPARGGPRGPAARHPGRGAVGAERPPRPGRDGRA